MSNSNSDSASDFEGRIKDQANSLKELVDSGDFGGALKVISALNETRDTSLYQEVGKLTRSLHEAIRNFNIETNIPSEDAELNKIADATDRLNYVIDLTNKSANKTLDLVEESMPIASTMKQEAEELKNLWAKLRRKEMKPDEFRALSKRIDGFLADLSGNTDKVYRNLSDILLAQDFQDLTGQVIQKVTGLVREVEENLVQLVSMAGRVDSITGTVHDLVEEEQDTIKGEGPQIQAEQRADVVSGQDDVDDLLSSLGF